MTEVVVTRKEGSIVCVKASGHAGYSKSGEDIVCAALSSVIQTAILGLCNVAKIDCKYSINDDLGCLELEIPNLGKEDRHNADLILETMLCGIADLHEGYSKYIKLEVK